MFALVFVVLGYDREGAAHVVSVHESEAGAKRAAKDARKEYPTVKIAPASLED